MSTILSRLGRNIKAFRTANGLSQEDLAARSGLHRTYVGAVERGERNISMLNVERIATALGVDPATLLSDN